MTEYHKIQTVYKRDPNTKHRTLQVGNYSLPEFEYLQRNEWVFTEKVDGTNIRVIVSEKGIEFRGRTDAAHIPPKLLERLQGRFLERVEAMQEMFGGPAVLYGEGYGAKIQRGGGNYREDQDFVLFDVRVGMWWLQRESVENIADALELDVVPVIGTGTLQDMVEMAKSGIKSTWGEFEAEGIVARPKTELVTRAGHRIITKIKCRDFA